MDLDSTDSEEERALAARADALMLCREIITDSEKSMRKVVLMNHTEKIHTISGAFYLIGVFLHSICEQNGMSVDQAISFVSRDLFGE